MAKPKEPKARTYRFEPELIEALEEMRTGQDLPPSETTLVKKALWAYITQWRETRKDAR